MHQEMKKERTKKMNYIMKKERTKKMKYIMDYSISQVALSNPNDEMHRKMKKYRPIEPFIS